MSEDGKTTTYGFGCKYFGEIAIIVVIGVLLWSICGMLTGYMFEIHEWGGMWILALVSVLPVVLVLAVIASIVVPVFASKRSYHSPRWLAKVIVSLWFLITFIFTLILVVSMGLKCGYLSLTC